MNAWEKIEISFVIGLAIAFICAIKSYDIQNSMVIGTVIFLITLIIMVFGPIALEIALG